MPMQRIGLDAGRAIPVTAQGRVTRDAIIRAALIEIEECGYLDARVENITRCAGVGYGTFYKYFAGKRDLVRAALSEAFEDIFRSPGNRLGGGTAIAEIVQATVIDRLRAYHRHRRALRVLDSAIGVDPGLAGLRNKLQREQIQSYAALLGCTADYKPLGSPLTVSFAVNSLIDEVGRRLAFASGNELAFPDFAVEEIAATVVPMILAVVASPVVLAPSCRATDKASALLGRPPATMQPTQPQRG